MRKEVFKRLAWIDDDKIKKLKEEVCKNGGIPVKIVCSTMVMDLFYDALKSLDLPIEIQDDAPPETFYIMSYNPSN